MKIGITGHTRGIGRSLTNIFTDQNHFVQGFSSSEGYDISKLNSRIQIVDKSYDCDVFVNNAYHKTGQLEMLKEIITQWESTDKIVIHISSIITQKEVTFMTPELLEYRNSKQECEKLIKNYKGTLKITNVILGLVDTDFSQPIKDYLKQSGMKPDSVANVIYEICSLQKDLTIKEITIDHQNSSL